MGRLFSICRARFLAQGKLYVKKFARECKYGHGAMQSVSPGENSSWALVLVNVNKEDEIASVDDGGFIRSDTVYTLNLFRCGSCGYMEIFDDIV